MEYSYATLVHLGGVNMYIRKDLYSTVLDNDEKRGIGPEAVRFKYLSDFNKHLYHSHVEGIIYQVGLDYVDLVDDDCITTVMTDKIAKVKWLDQNCREFADKCHNHHACECIEFHRCLDCKDKDDRKRRISLEVENKKCMKCKKNPVVCYDRSKKDCCHDHDRCHQDFTCFRDHAIPMCDDRFELRLAGLTDDLNFQLLKHKGCKVRFNIS